MSGNPESLRTFFHFQCFSPKCTENAIGPIVCSNIKFAKHLCGGDCFWIHSHFSMNIIIQAPKLNSTYMDLNLVWQERKQTYDCHPFELMIS